MNPKKLLLKGRDDKQVLFQHSEQELTLIYVTKEYSDILQKYTWFVREYLKGHALPSKQEKPGKSFNVDLVDCVAKALDSNGLVEIAAAVRENYEI